MCRTNLSQAIQELTLSARRTCQLFDFCRHFVQTLSLGILISKINMFKFNSSPYLMTVHSLNFLQVWYQLYKANIPKLGFFFGFHFFMVICLFSDFMQAKTYMAAFQKMIYIPISVLSGYVTAYFLLTRFLLKEKYFGFIILFVGLCLINLICAFWLTKFFVLLTQKLPFYELPA